MGNSGDAALDQDFILEVKFDAPFEPGCLVGSALGDEAALLYFHPDPAVFEEAGEVRSGGGDFLFVIDCSGSMDGSSIKAAKRALEACFRSLGPEDTFNIIKFGSGFKMFSKEPVRYDADNFKRGLRYIQSIDADMGGTELLSVVKTACKSPRRKGVRRDIVLITDGEVCDAGAVVKVAERHRGAVRFFTFGIGYGASHSLVRGVARASGGASEMIQPGESIENKVLRQFSRMTQPAIENLSVECSDCVIDFPNELPPMFADELFSILGKVESLGRRAEVAVSGVLNGKKVSWKCSARRSDDIGASLTALWAADRIRRLEWRLDDACSSLEKKTEKGDRAEIVELALKYNLLSSETCLIGMEKRAGKDKAFGAEYRRIPIALTKDYGAVSSGSLSLAPTWFCCSVPEQSLVLPSLSVAQGFLSRLNSAFFCRKAVSFDALEDDESNLSSVSGESGGLGDAWLEIMLTQTVDGGFDCASILARKFDMEPDEVEERLRLEMGSKPGGLAADVFKLAVLTVAAMELIRNDSELAEVAKRSLKKADGWLSEKVLPSVSRGNLLEIARRCGIAVPLATSS